jgi:DNA-binding NarL/FixJ family response regulator
MTNLDQPSVYLAGKKSVLLVEDHPLVLNSLRQLTEQAAPGSEIYEARTFSEAHQLALSGLMADLVLLDPGLPDVKGKLAVNGLRQLFSAATLVVVSANDLKFDIYNALDSGAQAFISKGAEPTEIVMAIEQALTSKVPLLTHWQKSMSISPEKTGYYRLSERQIEVLKGIAEGHSNKTIARLLNISDNTVKVHITAIFERLGVVNRTQATVIARRMGYFSEGSISELPDIT